MLRHTCACAEALLTVSYRGAYVVCMYYNYYVINFYHGSLVIHAHVPSMHDAASNRSKSKFMLDDKMICNHSRIT